METIYRSNNNIVFACRYHVVWCPKYRRKVLVSDVAERLKELISEVCASLRVVVVGIEIMPDHVHLLADVDPQFGIHRVVKNIKGSTSRILRGEFKHLTTRLPTLWTNSYFVSTAESVSLDVVKRYIEQQETSQRG